MIERLLGPFAIGLASLAAAVAGHLSGVGLLPALAFAAGAAVALLVMPRRDAESLRSREERFRRLADAVPQIVFVLRPDGRPEYLNRHWREYTGLAGTTYEDTLRPVHPDDVGRVNALWQRAAAAGEPFAAEVRLRCHDGAYRWFLSRSAPARGDGGAIEHWYGTSTDIHYQKLAAEALRLSEGQLRAFVEHSPGSVFIKDRDGRYVVANPAFVGQVGRPADDILGRTDADLFPPDVTARFAESERRVREEGRPLSSEDAVGLNGRPVTLLTHTFPLPGGAVGAVALDVSDRQRAEERLRDSEAHTSLAMGLARLGTWRWWPATSRVEADGRCREIVGLAEGELTLDDVVGRLHPDDAPRVSAALEAALRPDGDWTFSEECRFLRPGGDVRWVASRGRTLLMPDGGAEMVGTVLDVTERRLAEQALADAERQFRTLADSIPQLAWMARPDGDIFWYNRRWYDYTGTTLEGMQGWGWQTVHDPAVLPAVVERWGASIATGQPFDMVFPLRGADGAFRPFLTRVEPVRDDGGRVTRWFGTNTDVTEQQQADRRKDEFLATLAHELRNPLAPIRNSLELLRLGVPAAERDAAVAVIGRQLAALVRLVDDLLDVSRITRGKVELRAEPFDLLAAVRDAAETARPLADEKGHALTLDLPDGPVGVVGDRTRLAQVFANLINNAAKYSEPGGRIAVSVDVEGDDAVCRVRDGGVGIPAEELPRVFDLFTQVARSRGRSQGGLGIGLSLVKGLVEMHGGSVTAQSEGPGRGSTFTVKLRAEERGQRSEEKPHALPRSSALVPPPSRRILVADDNTDSADTLAFLLRHAGHEVRVAYDGAEAVEAAAAFAPDVAFLDLGMPRLDGFETAMRLRRSHPATRLVAMTGWGQPRDREETAAAGFHHHLVKPVDLDEVVALIGGERQA